MRLKYSLKHERGEGEALEGRPAAATSTSASSSSTSSATAAIGSTDTSSREGSTLGLFVVPSPGSAGFFCALRYFRKVAPMGALR